MTVQQQIIQILIDYSGQEDILPETTIESINLDSLDLAEISCDIQDLVGVDIDETQLLAIKTVKELIDFVTLNFKN